jgi:uncharacterized protein (UPF0333 family)
MKYILVILLIIISSHSYATINKTRIVDTTKIVYSYVSYSATLDDNNIYINLSTKDKKTMLTFLRFGITIYFNVDGTENENVYVKYPQKALRQELKINDVFDLDQAIDHLELKKLIKNLPKEAEYGYFESIQQFHIGLNNLDIEVSFSSNKNDILEYKLRVPKTKIATDSQADFTKLRIGVRSGKSITDKPKQDKGLVISTLGTNNNNRNNVRQIGSYRQRSLRNRSGTSQNRKNTDKKNNSQKPSKKEEPLMPILNFWFDTNFKE